MAETEFRERLDALVPDYAQDNVRAGNYTSTEAIERARREIAEVVPEGLRTPDHHAAHIVPAGGQAPVGWIWYSVRRDRGPPKLFVWNLVIYEPHRRHGYATAALKALEPRARELGVDRVVLHVFGDNGPARALYEKLGFETTNVLMSKRLPPP